MRIFSKCTMEDNFKHKGLRKKLIEDIRKTGGVDAKVLEVMESIPRHFFFEKAFEHFAYENTAFQIGSGQTISQPLTVAIQSTLLKINRNDKILEIGTGSGYQTIVLCRLGAKVYSIERQKELYLKAQQIFPMFDCIVKSKYGDGYKGWPSFAPFDKILVTCAAPYIPEALVEQLANGGRMVIPVGAEKVQKMLVIDKDENGNISEKDEGDFRFVPMLEKIAK